MARGVFITFEGVEGAGKSTQIRLLEAHLKAQGREVVVTREPGGTTIAEAIRRVLLDPNHDAMTATTELLLYEAARAQHVEERIRPLVNEGRIVLCDRFADSTTAYQSGGRGLPRDVIGQLHEIAAGGLLPDLTVLIDLPPEIGLVRATQAVADRMEGESLAFHERVRAEFLRLAREDRARIKVVDGLLSVEALAEEIGKHVDALLGSL